MFDRPICVSESGCWVWPGPITTLQAADRIVAGAPVAGVPAYLNRAMALRLAARIVDLQAQRGAR